MCVSVSTLYSLVSLYKGNNLIMRAPPSLPHLNLITSQRHSLQLSLWGYVSPYEFGETTFSPLTPCDPKRLASLKTLFRLLLYYPCQSEPWCSVFPQKGSGVFILLKEYCIYNNLLSPCESPSASLNHQVPFL